MWSNKWGGVRRKRPFQGRNGLCVCLRRNNRRTRRRISLLVEMTFGDEPERTLRFDDVEFPGEVDDLQDYIAKMYGDDERVQAWSAGVFPEAMA